MNILAERRDEIGRRFASLVEDAQKEYLATAEEGQKDFLSPQITSANALLRLLRDQNERFVNFRSRERRLIDVVGSLLKPIEIIGSAVAGAAEEAFPPAQGIFSAIMYLVGAANDVSQMYDAIIDLFSRLQDFTIRLEFYIKEEMSPQLREKVVQILAALFETLLIATAEVNRGRVKAYFRKVFARESKVPEALAKLSNLTRGEEGLVMAETLASIKRSISIQHQLAEEVENLRAETRERTALSNRQRLRTILEPSVYPEDSYNALKNSRTPGTGDWFVKDPNLQDWVDGLFPFLWVCGNPGTGKSYLASRLISHVEEILSQPDTPLDSLAYFFFRENNPETRSVNQALRDIAYQLSEDDGFYGNEILRKLGSRDDIKTISSAFRALISTPCTTDTRKRTIYIFLDGIDEAESTELNEFLGLVAGSPSRYQSTRIQVAMVGRNVMTETVSMFLDEDGTSELLRSIYITPERIAEDVRAYIVDEVRRSRVLRRSRPEFKQEVVERMLKQVDGLFILARFMVSEISRKTHPRMIMESLDGYPSEINGMLYKMMEQLSATLSEAHAADLNEALMWVTCAEQTLTLDQIEIILELRFGDEPFNLEETIRNQYSCFFVLDRDDGLTTADIYQRHADQNPPLPPRKGSRSPSSSRSPDSGHEGSDFFGPPVGVEFNSNKKTTTIMFYHASITEFLRDEISNHVRSKLGGPAIGFDLAQARLHILKTCLRILLEPESFRRSPTNGPMWRYATWYWQEHLVCADISKVVLEDKKHIGRCLYKLITSPEHILDWTQEEESLKLFTDPNMVCLRKWMTDPEVLSGLDEQSRGWVMKATSEPAGLVETIGRIYARAWLDPEFGSYIPTMTCFQIVHSVAFIEDGHTWSDSDYEWASIPPRSAHSLRRIGSTYLVLGLHDEALKHFNEALPLDGDMVETCGRIAYCYMINKQYDRALIKHLMCETLEERLIAEGRFNTPRQQDFSKWRLYTNRLQIAKCYSKLDRIEDSLIYFQKAIASAYEPDKFEPEEAYLEVLGAHNQHGLIMELLDWMDNQPGKVEGQSRLIDFLVEQASGTADLEWVIPKTACRRQRSDFMAEKYRAAIDVATSRQATAAQLNLRLSLANLKFFSRDYNGAIAIHEEISEIGGHPRGSVLVRTLHTLSLRSRAQVYNQMMINVISTSAEADALFAKLHELQEYHVNVRRGKDMPQSLYGIDVNDASLYLGLLYSQRGKIDEARRLLSAIIVESFEILNDDEPQNDAHALENLSRALVAIGDIDNAKALFESMRRPSDDLAGSAHSPISLRPSQSRIAEVFLPYSRPHPLVCLQCLNTIMETENVVICARSLDPFCEECMQTVIRVEGNKTADGKADLVCKADHEWFTAAPLRMRLSRGEILVGGQVRTFDDWEEAVKALWAPLAKPAIK
ncbi:uncharacterized protein DNG_08222 [Cephalotrichum gorgonifer]|uniref:Uncharacterized protein n=1 Tax=Cephalotrichum gorgonifer TaxID=2041049 RepID=A0AAE8SY53_9PEZI|nr:uncharacterized protein DNG_08222 [Cephalotrichum gorgonifer]